MHLLKILITCLPHPSVIRSSPYIWYTLGRITNAVLPANTLTGTSHPTVSLLISSHEPSSSFGKSGFKLVEAEKKRLSWSLVLAGADTRCTE